MNYQIAWARSALAYAGDVQVLFSCPPTDMERLCDGVIACITKIKH